MSDKPQCKSCKRLEYRIGKLLETREAAMDIARTAPEAVEIYTNSPITAMQRLVDFAWRTVQGQAR